MIQDDYNEGDTTDVDEGRGSKCSFQSWSNVEQNWYEGLFGKLSYLIYCSATTRQKRRFTLIISRIEYPKTEIKHTQTKKKRKPLLINSMICFLMDFLNECVSRVVTLINIVVV